MKYITLAIMALLISTNVVSAFSNSLDGSNQEFQQNNSSSQNNNNFKNNQNQPLNPKVHSGFEHQDRQFPEPTMNDSRYNSSCQFGTCFPGGINQE